MKNDDGIIQQEILDLGGGTKRRDKRNFFKCFW